MEQEEKEKEKEKEERDALLRAPTLIMGEVEVRRLIVIDGVSLGCR